MNEGKKLTIQMAFFFLIVFVLFGTIIVKEKQNILFLPKIENSITNYISDHYSELTLNQSEVSEKNNIFSMKVTNPHNPHHYFYITYSNKKISDTYTKDYLEGQSLLSHLSNYLSTELYKATNQKYQISFDNTLNNYSTKVQEKLLQEDIRTLKVYTVETEYVMSWDAAAISNQITATMTTLTNTNFTPKNYTITITNIHDITQSVKISNLKLNTLENDNLFLIINDILNNEKTNILNENKITFEYLN